MKKVILQSLSAFVFLFAIIIGNNESSAQYCTPGGYYPYYGYMTRFVFNGIDNSSTYAPTGYSNYSSITSNPCILGQSYSFNIYGYSVWGNNYSGYNIWIDFNRNYTFESGEWVAGNSLYGYGPNFSGTISIPTTAASGITRMRINYCGYYYYAYYTYLYGACYSYYYMEWEDYSINILGKTNDAGITDITSPVDKFDSYQPQPVRVVLKNFGKFFPLTSVTINWSIDGVTQTPYQWTGYLDTGQTTTVEIHSGFQFTPYAPWNPFTIRAWTTNPQGPDPNANAQPDGDASNDSKTKNIAPILNDAGFLNADGMIPIEPGVNNVKLRIKNYAPKPLSSVAIRWWVNGYEQTTYYWTGNLAAQDSIDVTVGTYDFGTANLPFTIKASTQNPNGYPDDNPSNDENTVQVYKALAGGTYSIGGRNPDFVDIEEFVNYISYWGIAGPVILNIRPGTYQAGLLIEPHGTRQFPMTFQSSTGRNDDVIIVNHPMKNYVFYINNHNNITFKNLTLKNNNGCNIITLSGNNDNIFIDNCILEACQNPSQNYTNALIVSQNNLLRNFKLNNSILRNGSVGLWVVSPSGQFSDKIEVSNNVFLSQNWQAIHIENANNTNIHDNTISGLNLLYGIYVLNGSTIANNRISGIGPASTTSINDTSAGISVVHTSTSETATIIDNAIMGSNINGIYISGAGGYNVSNNQITISSTASYTKAGMALFNTGSQGSFVQRNFINNSNTRGIYLENSTNSKIYYNTVKASNSQYGIHAKYSSAIIANNIVSTSNTGALYLDSVYNTYLFYNSFVGSSNSTIAFLNNLLDGNIIKRNIIYNRGTGNAFQVFGALPGILTSDENNLYTAGTNLASGSIGTVPDLQTWQTNTGLDSNSVSLIVYFMADDNPRIAKIDPLLYFRHPDPHIASLALTNEIEKFDIDGNTRTRAYYIGTNTLNPRIHLVNPPNDVIGCVGTSGNYFSVYAEIDFGGTLSYQWYRNGVEIPGANEAVYFLPPLTFEMAGVYRCKIMGNGEAEDVWTDPVLLYAVLPTKITRQPTEVYADLGAVASFQVDVHITTDEQTLVNPKFQWYRGNTKLSDNDRIAGSQSSIMTIRDLKPNDYGNDYRVIVTGLCGTDTSNFIELKQIPHIVAQPFASVQVCEGQNAQFTVNAISTVPGFRIKYQWRFNGVNLEDGTKYTGTQTETLTINNVTPSDAGSYDVILTIEGFETKVVGPADLVVFLKPVINVDLPSTLDVKVGDSLTLSINAEGTDLTYTWYKDDVDLGVTENELTISSAQNTDAGTYKVKVSNQCGEVWSSECVVTVTYKTILSNEEQSGLIELLPNKPNPFDTKTFIEFFLSESKDVILTINNSLGEKVAEFTLGNCHTGLNRFEFNPVQFNLSAGIYFYTLKVDGIRLTRQMVFVK
ncbi:MAG: immunoglobulin domain-containing protein [Candidatus Kapaibacteriales bacterium]